MLKHRYKHSVSAFYNYSSENFWSSYTDNAGHRAWSGYAFEQVCLAHIKQIKKALGISGVHTDVSSWVSRGDWTVGTVGDGTILSTLYFVTISYRPHLSPICQESFQIGAKECVDFYVVQKRSRDTDMLTFVA